MNLRRMRRVGLISLGAVAVLGLSSCDAFSSIGQPDAAVVLTGDQLDDLLGRDPGNVVAFRYRQVYPDNTWVQIPVQIDERKVVGFGSQPTSNSTPGVMGTVYGSGAPGITALQYADSGTFVGADTDATFDADDELVFMAADAGGKVNAAAGEPAGVVAGSGVAVQVDVPGEEQRRGWVYLFESATLDPAAGQDYVDYQFNLTSGDYKTTYKRATGYNAETSTVTTDNYEIGYTERWFEDSWKVLAPGASGVDILDGHKNQFGLNTCIRSNVTFSHGEGAFVANIDGPVRAIRAYVGANSGPLTQRTHLMYRAHQDVITDLRVHAVLGIWDFVDYNVNATGMTYRNSVIPAGVTIDGVADTLPVGIPTWESADGPQGQVRSFSEFTSSATLGFGHVYFDDVAPAAAGCWGDSSFFGMSGGKVIDNIPNTDPRSAPFETLQSRRVTHFSSPSTDTSKIPDEVSAWAQSLQVPFVVTATPYLP